MKRHFIVIIKILIVGLFPFSGIGQQSSVFKQGNISNKNINILKAPLDTATFFDWPSIKLWPRPSLSGNGKYLQYFIKNVPSNGSSIVIQRTDTNWRVIFPAISIVPQFSIDNSHIIFQYKNDTICILNLLSGEKEFIGDTRSYQLLTREGKEWLIIHRHSELNELIIRDINNNFKKIVRNVNNFSLSELKGIVVIQVKKKQDDQNSFSLLWNDLVKGEEKEIWGGKEPALDLKVNNEGNQAVFYIKEKSKGGATDGGGKAIWIYRDGENQAVKVTDGPYLIMGDTFELANLVSFSKNNDKLFAFVKKMNLKVKGIPINIWSYSDPKLQPQQLKEINESKGYLAAISLSNPKHIFRIQNENESVDDKTDNLFLVTERKGEISESYWNKESFGASYLVSVFDRKRVKLLLSKPKFSPCGKYVIGYAPNVIVGEDIYIYEIATGETRNITKKVKLSSSEKYYKDLPMVKTNRLFKLAAWLPNDELMLIYDDYDIWKIDPQCKKMPEKLTQGRSKECQFRLAGDGKSNVVKFDELLILQSFNFKTKESGFFEISLDNTHKSPIKLFEGDYIFSVIQKNRNFKRLENAVSNLNLVKRERCNESANIFITTDFKHFLLMSDVYPEKKVNWLTSELISYTDLIGKQTTAILYKPENFNPANVYPLIIHYYDKRSNEKNKYPEPIESAAGGDLDISWFVSNGYLVLVPDINFTIGKIGESIYNSIIGAANYIGKRPYIDKTHIGIQGHSFGGYETNILITHSNMFAAAVSSCGISNIVSDYGNLWHGNTAKQEYWEMRSGRLATTPWANPDVYVKNSPIFYVGKVQTPLLMVANRPDKNVYFEQGLEFFTALRREGKRVWMLEYENGDHGVSGDDYKDYLFRMTQFFDHYLKEKPAPKWMTRGVPAALKGFDGGFDLDLEIKTPGAGLLKY